MLGLLATLSLIAGYLGTLLTQTMTFAADEFGAGTAAQGDRWRPCGSAAARDRLGALADRRGRRLILTAALSPAITSTVLGALAPNLAVLAATQAVTGARGPPPRCCWPSSPPRRCRPVPGPTR